MAKRIILGGVALIFLNCTIYAGLMRNNVSLWPGGQIPYVFDNSIQRAHRATVREALAEWNNRTCVNFRPRTNERVYLIIRKTRGTGSSKVGMIGRISYVNLALGANRNFNRGHAMHELGHAIGLEHEHRRPDRDYNINISPRHTGNRNNRIIPQNNANITGRYDVNSIMHYDSNDGYGIFRKNGAYIHFNATLSANDIAAVNKVYCPIAKQGSNLGRSVNSNFSRNGLSANSVEKSFANLVPTRAITSTKSRQISLNGSKRNELNRSARNVNSDSGYLLVGRIEQNYKRSDSGDTLPRPNSHKSSDLTKAMRRSDEKAVLAEINDEKKAEIFRNRSEQVFENRRILQKLKSSANVLEFANDGSLKEGVYFKELDGGKIEQETKERIDMSMTKEGMVKNLDKETVVGYSNAL